MIVHRKWHWLALVGVLAMLCILAIAFGSVHLPIMDVIRALTGIGGEADPTTAAIIHTLRLPRIALALLIGAGLGMSGAALQGSLRNALAEPYLLGVSGGAAVGAVIAFSLNESNEAVIALAAFVGAATAVFLALTVARVASYTKSDPRTLLMAGVIIGAFANAVIMVALANAPANTLRGALWWMMGSAADANWHTVSWMATYLAIGGGALLYWAREIDALALGEDPAAALGVNVDVAGKRIFLLSALLAAATVASAGLIGFVGLVVPHIVRGAGVRKHRPLLVGAGLVGAALVVTADLAARTLRPPGELPLGAVTALLGVPFFLIQLRKIR